MKKQVFTMILVVVAFGLGGCMSKPSYLEPPKKAAVYDDSKSYAYNVLSATTTKKFASVDSPGGGLTKPRLSTKDKEVEKALQAEAVALEKAEIESGAALDPQTAAALDIGTSIWYNDMITSGWSSGKLTSGGLTKGQSLGIAAGLALIGGMAQSNPNQGIMEDHDILYFSWKPKSEINNKNDATEWLTDVLLDAYDAASREVEIQEPYEFDYAFSKAIGDKVYPAWVRVMGGWCDLDNVGCYLSVNSLVDAHSTVSPEFLGGEDSWLLAAGATEKVYEGRFRASEKPEDYQKPKFESLSFFLKVSENLPDDIYMLLPGKNPYRNVLYRNEEGELEALARPVLINKGEMHRFQSPPEEVAQLRKDAGKKFLGIF